MLAFPAAIRIYVAVQPVDMRKSFNGLWSAVRDQLHEESKSGALFCFINKERTRLKLLYFSHFTIRFPNTRSSIIAARRSPGSESLWVCLILQADAYGAYASHERAHDEVVRVGCHR
jgi:hypothetical protein